MYFFFKNMYLELTLASYLLIQGFCEDCRFSMHSDSGEIQSPNYPFNYPLDIQCTWDISSVNSTQLSLYFDAFDIEFDARCEKDVLIISFGGPRQVTACGNTIYGKTLVSQSGFFHLVFQTDGNNREHDKGFHAIFHAITHDVQTTVDRAIMSSRTETGEHPEVRSSSPTDNSLSSIASTKDTTTLPQATITVPQTIVSVKQTAREHSEVRSSTPTGDSLSSIAKIKDTTTLPPATVNVPHDIVSVKQTTREHSEVRLSTPTGDSLSSIAKIKDTTTLQPATVNVPRDIVSVKQTTLSMDTPLDKPQNHGGVGTIIAASLGAGVAIVIVIGLLILFIKRKRSIPKTKIPSNITDDSSRMYPIEASGIETHIESASPDSIDMPRNQDVYAVPMKKGFRKEEIYHESLTEYIKT